MIRKPLKEVRVAFIGCSELDVFGYLDLLKYRCRSGFADIWTEGCFKGDPDDKFMKKIRHEMDARELVLSNLCVDGPTLWVDSPEERKAHKDSMLQYLHAAEILDAKTVRIDFGVDDESMKTIWDRKPKTLNLLYDIKAGRLPALRLSVSLNVI